MHVQIGNKPLTVRPLSKSEAEDFAASVAKAALAPPVAAPAQRSASSGAPVSPPRVGDAAAPAPRVASQRAQQAAPAALAAAPSKAPAIAAPGRAAAAAGKAAAAQNGKAPSGPPSRVLRLANMVGFIMSFHPACHACLQLYLQGAWTSRDIC